MKKRIVLLIACMFVFSNSAFAINSISRNEYIEGNIYKKEELMEA